MLTCLVTVTAATRAEQPATVTIFAASSLGRALEDVAAGEAKALGLNLKIVVAASSTHAKQIENGAEADIFVSADDAWMDHLNARGLIVDATRQNLVGNRLVLVVPKPDAREIDLSQGLKAWQPLLAGRIATGDPAHVPVGRYAQEALISLGVWADVAPRLARADNVRSALVLVERGEATGAIVYASDAIGNTRVHVAARFSSSHHRPIVYPAAIVTGRDRGSVRTALAVLMSDQTRAVFVRYGFEVK